MKLKYLSNTDKTFLFKQTPLHYNDIGKGDVIIFIHGFLENRSMWESILPSLSKSNRCITLDLFGHGKSQALGYVHEMRTYAEAISKLINTIQIENYSIVGHSMGGYVAMELLKLEEQKIDQLILLNSSPLADTDERKKDRDRAIRAIQKFPEAFVQMAVKNLFLPRDQEKLAQQIENAIFEAKKCSKQGIIATLQGLKNRANHKETFKKANCKKLVIAGKLDQVVHFNTLKNSIKDSKANLLSFKGGHMSHLEYPQEVLLAIKNFLKIESHD